MGVEAVQAAPLYDQDEIVSTAPATIAKTPEMLAAAPNNQMLDDLPASPQISLAPETGAVGDDPLLATTHNLKTTAPGRVPLTRGTSASLASILGGSSLLPDATGKNWSFGADAGQVQDGQFQGGQVGLGQVGFGRFSAAGPLAGLSGYGFPTLHTMMMEEGTLTGASRKLDSAAMAAPSSLSASDARLAALKWSRDLQIAMTKLGENINAGAVTGALQHSEMPEGGGVAVSSTSQASDEEAAAALASAPNMLDWVVQGISSPLGILACMFVLFILGLWAAVSSAAVMRDRMQGR